MTHSWPSCDTGWQSHFQPTQPSLQAFTEWFSYVKNLMQYETLETSSDLEKAIRKLWHWVTHPLPTNPTLPAIIQFGQTFDEIWNSWNILGLRTSDTPPTNPNLPAIAQLGHKFNLILCKLLKHPRTKNKWHKAGPNQINPTLSGTIRWLSKWCRWWRWRWRWWWWLFWILPTYFSHISPAHTPTFTPLWRSQPGQIPSWKFKTTN